MQLQAAGRPTGDVYIWGRERREEMLAAIKRALVIWRDQRDESMEAWKMEGIISVMLEKLNSMSPTGETNGSSSMLEVPEEKQNAAMTLGLLSSGMSPQDTATAGFTTTDSIISPPVAVAGVPADNLGFTSPFGMLGGPMPDMQLDWVCCISKSQKLTYLIVRSLLTLLLTGCMG